VPELELAVPEPAPRPPPQPRKKVEEEPFKIELAVDVHPSYPPPKTPSRPPSLAPGAIARKIPSDRPPRTADMMGSDEAMEAQRIAAYGDPPGFFVMAPFYAYRVWQRKKDLERIVAERREDEENARLAAEDAMIAFADRARPMVARDPQYTRALSELQTAEELVRSRDQGLAREQDAHAERLRAIDQRMIKMEEELKAAKEAERLAAEKLAEAEAELRRMQARLQRAEIDQRNSGKEG
jgi:hypothetical protein